MARRHGETIDDTTGGADPQAARVAGLLVVATADAPVVALLPLPREGAPIVLGREHGGPLFEQDTRLSRRHAEIAFDGASWTVRDLGSRNGTFVDGAPVAGEVRAESAPRVVRLGRTVLRPLEDIRPFVAAATAGTLRRPDGTVAGPAFTAALEVVRRAASASDTLLITGESGTGKEVAARAFHLAGPHGAPGGETPSTGGGNASRPPGPFIAVNCATIPHGLAERLLFGAKKGAFSGAAADAVGYVQSAEQGVLFLDELGELDLEVQAKLLRFLETHEVVPLGGASARTVRVRVCLATHRDLRAAVGAGRFRADLYYRVAEPHAHLPPLRERTEEIPWLLAAALAGGGDGAPGEPVLSADARLVEACMLRAWPGNVRELLHAARAAAQNARAAGSAAVKLEHLDPNAGAALGEAGAAAAGASVASGAARAGAGAASARPAAPRGELSREAVEHALREAGGNVAATARALGLHRTQLYRVMRRLGLAAAAGAAGEAGEEGDGDGEE